MKKVSKGDKVWLKPSGNLSRRGGKDPIECEVVAVGSKYITVAINDYQTAKFDIETLRQHTMYTADYILYMSKEELDREAEESKMLREVREAIDKQRITYDQLKAIHTIITTQQ